MRRFFGVALLALGLMGVRVEAQLVDPSTGIMVDAATDPMDFSAVASGQPGNFGMEAAAEASAQAQALSASVAAQNSTDDAPVLALPPALPTTPKPVITPGGGTFDAGIQVILKDSDAAAVLFYTTDGKRPTTSSPRYAEPLMVTAKTKVRAVAFDVNMQPSGVVSKTFKMKIPKGTVA